MEVLNIPTANNSKIQIKTSGWKQITVTSGTFLINENERIAYYYYNVYNKTNNNSPITVTNIPSGYRPQNSIINPGHTSNGLIAVIGDDGKVYIQGTSTGYCFFNNIWKY